MKRSPSLLLPWLCLLLLIASAVPAWAARDNYRLPAGIKVGGISGPGCEELVRVLKSRTGGGGQQGVLSGQVSLVSRMAPERETVALKEPAGEPYEIYKPDDFTTRLWRVEERPMADTTQIFDLERQTGTMVFDWRVTSPEGRLMDQGRVTLDINRSRGGYLASVGVTPPLGGGSRGQAAKFERYLAEELARLLTLDLGWAVSTSNLESGNDKWSREARSLASRGDWEGARRLWLELLDMNSEYGPALYNLGLYYERQKNPEEAWGWYRKAFLSEGSDLHRAALTRLTESLSRSGRLPKRNVR